MVFWIRALRTASLLNKRPAQALALWCCCTPGLCSPSRSQTMGWVSDAPVRAQVNHLASRFSTLSTTCSFSLLRTISMRRGMEPPSAPYVMDQMPACWVEDSCREGQVHQVTIARSCPRLRGPHKVRKVGVRTGPLPSAWSQHRRVFGCLNQQQAAIPTPTWPEGPQRLLASATLWSPLNWSGLFGVERSRHPANRSLRAL